MFFWSTSWSNLQTELSTRDQNISNMKCILFGSENRRNAFPICSANCSVCSCVQTNNCNSHRCCPDRWLSLPTRLRLHQTLIPPVLFYAPKTCSLLVAGIESLAASTQNGNNTFSGFGGMTAFTALSCNMHRLLHNVFFRVVRQTHDTHISGT